MEKLRRHQRIILSKLEDRISSKRVDAFLGTGLALAKTQPCNCALGKKKYVPFCAVYGKHCNITGVKLNPFNKNFHCLRAHPSYGEEVLSMGEFNLLRTSFKGDPLDDLDSASLVSEAGRYYPFVQRMKHLLGMKSRRREQREDFVTRHVEGRKVKHGDGEDDDEGEVPVAQSWPGAFVAQTEVKKNANSLHRASEVENFTSGDLDTLMVQRLRIPDVGNVVDNVTTRSLRNLMDTKKALISAIQKVGGIQVPERSMVFARWSRKENVSTNAITYGAASVMDEEEDQSNDMNFDKFICILSSKIGGEDDADSLVEKHVLQTTQAMERSERSKKRKADRILRGDTKRPHVAKTPPAAEETPPTKYMNVVVADMTEKEMNIFAEKNRHMIIAEFKKNMRRIRRRRQERESKRNQIFCYNCTIGRKDQQEIPPYFDAERDFFAD